MDTARIERLVSEAWDGDIVPQLIEYIRIPNKSPMFDANWQANGYMDAATELLADWARKQPIAGMKLEVVRLEGRTPLIFIEIDGQGDDCVLLYGHLDKQPEMTGWADDLGPWKPVIRGDRLYGRGGADDGYAIFGSLTAIRALQEQGLPHSRCVILIEACEESGSYDLPYYVDHLAERIGKPSLVVCLDSGCANYDQLWCTTSLRGLAGGNLKRERAQRRRAFGRCLGRRAVQFPRAAPVAFAPRGRDDRRDPAWGTLVEIPAERLQQARRAAEVLGDDVYDKFPFLPGMVPMSKDLAELVLNRTWRPMLSITGADGFPPLSAMPATCCVRTPRSS